MEARKVDSGAHSQTLNVTRKEIDVDTNTLRLYTGDYELDPNFILRITLENGKLQAQAAGQGKNGLYAEKNNFFLLKVLMRKLNFSRAPTLNGPFNTLSEWSETAR